MVSTRSRVTEPKLEDFGIEPIPKLPTNLARIRTNFLKSKKAYDTSLWEAMASSCKAAMQLRDRAEWKKFRLDPFWTEKKLPENVPTFKKRLSFALRFTVNVQIGKNDRISKYGKAVRNLLTDCVSPEKMSKELKTRGGIQACAKSARLKNAGRTVPTDKPEVQSRIKTEEKNRSRTKGESDDTRSEAAAGLKVVRCSLQAGRKTSDAMRKLRKGQTITVVLKLVSVGNSPTYSIKVNRQV